MASSQVEGAVATKEEQIIEVPPAKITEEKEKEVVVHEVVQDDDDDDEDHEDKLPHEEEVENAEKDHQIASPIDEEDQPFDHHDATFEDETEGDLHLDGDY
ncbi:hypothetical protein Ddye_015457 [Dipteronia dyeriana]|uniref:Uncharacterized protein n=1 Tax=Dipteronia dyeriana TaxID=168575 RepID=A0AAD9U5L6_9ROSI|nr:hypothetical protein Ddye_015457 [Dipteronia dyeriana]